MLAIAWAYPPTLPDWSDPTGKTLRRLGRFSVGTGVAGALLGLSVLCAPAANAAPAFSNGSFEVPVVSANTFRPVSAGQPIGAWTVTRGNVDHIGAGFWPAADGTQSIDLDGSIALNLAGAVAQTFSTLPVHLYREVRPLRQPGQRPGREDGHRLGERNCPEVFLLRRLRNSREVFAGGSGTRTVLPPLPRTFSTRWPCSSPTLAMFAPAGFEDPQSEQSEQAYQGEVVALAEPRGDPGGWSAMLRLAGSVQPGSICSVRQVPAGGAGGPQLVAGHGGEQDGRPEPQAPHGWRAREQETLDQVRRRARAAEGRHRPAIPGRPLGGVQFGRGKSGIAAGHAVPDGPVGPPALGAGQAGRQWNPEHPGAARGPANDDGDHDHHGHNDRDRDGESDHRAAAAMVPHRLPIRVQDRHQQHPHHGRADRQQTEGEHPAPTGPVSEPLEIWLTRSGQA